MHTQITITWWSDFLTFGKVDKNKHKINRKRNLSLNGNKCVVVVPTLPSYCNNYYYYYDNTRQPPHIIIYLIHSYASPHHFQQYLLFHHPINIKIHVNQWKCGVLKLTLKIVWIERMRPNVVIYIRIMYVYILRYMLISFFIYFVWSKTKSFINIHILVSILLS